MIKSYWVRLLVFMVVGGAIALGVSLVVPKKYEGQVQILIDQKAVIPNIPVNSVAASVSDLTDFARSRGITTQVKQLTSFGVISTAAQATWEQVGPGGPPTEEFDVYELVKNISIDAEVGSDIVSLQVRMSTQKYAETMASNLYAAFQDFNIRTTRELAGQAILSLEEQMKGVNTRLVDLDTRAKNLREKLNAPNLDAQVQADIGNIAHVKDQRDLAAIDLASAEGRLRILERNIKDVPKTILASKSEAFNQNLYALDQQLATLRSDLVALEERFTPDHEQVKATRARIQKIEQERASQLSNIQAGSTVAPNPLYQSMEGQLSDAQATVNALRQRLNQAEEELSVSETQLEQYPEAQTQLVALGRQQASLERVYAQYADLLEPLKLAEQGRSAPTRLAGVSVNPDPVSPKPIINMLVGMVLGLILGIMSMLRTESSRQPIRSIMQLNLLSDEPVFRALPNMSSPFRGLDRTPPETFDALVATALRADKRPYRVGFVGIVRDSGSSTGALNYAVSASRRGLNALLVSLDPRSPNARRLGMTGAGVQRVNDHLSFIEMTGVDVVVGSGGKTSINESLAALERDVTVFDFEASTDAADYAFVASELDEVVLLVRANRVNSVDFLAVQQALKDSGVQHITIMLARGSESDAIADASDPAEFRALPS
ncbi:MAG: hypothetical protein M9921_12605 [Fimbriimonadaceae bacterium]|nr:hypothetical protein [Chthonomonadaceae bacterium]MCO5297689.1 hypothetical protein [Fimbriimonadaceae bacterium]